MLIEFRCHFFYRFILRIRLWNKLSYFKLALLDDKFSFFEFLYQLFILLASFFYLNCRFSLSWNMRNSLEDLWRIIFISTERSIEQDRICNIMYISSLIMIVDVAAVKKRRLSLLLSICEICLKKERLLLLLFIGIIQRRGSA